MVPNRCRGIARTAVVASLVLLLYAAMPAAFAAAPANDDLANATVVTSLPFSDSLNTAEATAEPNEPDCFGNFTSVWYSFTPTADIELEAKTFGSDYDTTLSAWVEEGGQLVNVGCVDDSLGTLQSRLRFTGSAGVTYLIRAGTYFDSPGGNLVFSLDVAPPLSPPPVLELTIDPDGAVTRTGVARITGTLTCSEPLTDTFVDLFVRQTVSRPVVEGFGSAYIALCDGPTAWEASVYPSQGQFVAGTVTATGHSFACDADEQCTEVETIQSVLLRAGVR